MEQSLAVASSAYYDYPKRPNPKWSVTLTHCVSIYRSEVHKMRAAENYRLMQKLKRNEARRGRKEFGGLDDE
jgi:hypothetical protein